MMSAPKLRSSGHERPRVDLLQGPTPLLPLARLTTYLGSPPIFVKRDDLTGVGLGGNKVRKLEYLLGDARARGYHHVITGGGLQSNSATLTAVAAAMAGMSCELALTQNEALTGHSYTANGNRLLQSLAGATSSIFPHDMFGAAAIAALAADRRDVYLLPFGCSSALGALGYVDAVSELAAQLEATASGTPARVLLVLASGSGGTQAGLAAGICAQDLQWEVCGFSVVHRAADLAAIVDPLIQETLDLSGTAARAAPAWTDDRALGAGYGLPTEEGLASITLALKCEGLLLDPVYTSKAFAGLLSLGAAGMLNEYDAIVFWHTGGAGGLFGYASVGPTPGIDPVTLSNPKPVVWKSPTGVEVGVPL